jgi:hypothetical protein
MPCWRDENLSRDDPADQAAGDLHDRSVMGPGEA